MIEKVELHNFLISRDGAQRQIFQFTGNKEGLQVLLAGHIGNHGLISLSWGEVNELTSLLDNLRYQYDPDVPQAG